MALFLNRELEGGALISVWEIEESEEELLALLSVPSDELEEMDLIKSLPRRRERLAVRAILNSLFEGKVYLGHHDNGRPYLQNSAIEISISHTSRFAAILTHPYESVGIDIERVSRDFTAVENRALSKGEIESLSDRERNLHLAIFWSAKEAVYKRMSRSYIDFAKQIEIKRFTPRESGSLTAIYTGNEGLSQEFELSYELIEDHVMTWLIG